MKILVAGNLVNHGEYHTKLLREKGVDADLLKYDTNKPGWKIDVIKTMRKYDLIHASTELPIFAMLSRKPYVATTTGSDMTELANQKSLKGRMLRMAYRKARKVIFLSPNIYQYTKKLKLRNQMFLPIIPDLSFFSPGIETNNKSFTIFHPTNHLWDVKGNDILIDGFLEAYKQSNDIKLIIVKRGNDFQRSHKKLEENPNIILLPNTLDQESLRKYYSISDVIADQFISGSTGLIGQEAMACGKALIQYADIELYQTFYPELPPIVNCKTSDDVCKAIIHLKNHRELLKEIGMRSHEWITKYHGPNVIEKYIQVYNEVL
jgi:glycosyltransferase involved in cell wall biosynthesis